MTDEDLCTCKVHHKCIDLTNLRAVFKVFLHVNTRPKGTVSPAYGTVKLMNTIT